MKINPFSPDVESLKKSMDKLSGPKFIYSNLQIVAETTREFARESLAPCFDLLETPLIHFSIGKWLCNAYEGFDIGGVSIPCSYRGIAGGTTMVMYLNNDMINHISREGWGEPKRYGTTQMFHYGDNIYAYCERNGERLFEIKAEFSANLGPVEGSGHSFEVRAFPDPLHFGLQYDPVVTTFAADAKELVYKEGTGVLRLNPGKHDHLDQIPIVKIVKAVYTEGRRDTRIESVDTITENTDGYISTWGRLYDRDEEYPVSYLFDK